MKKLLICLVTMNFVLSGCAWVTKYKGRKTLLITIGPAIYLDIDRDIEVSGETKENPYR